MSNSNLAGVLPLFIVLGLGVSVVCIVAWCKIFRKADIHPGKLFIPFYGQYLMYSIANCEGLFAASIVISVLSSLCSSCASSMGTSGEGAALLLVLLAVLTVALLIINIVFLVRLAKAFDKSNAFAVGLIFLYPIFICILGFDNSVYVG
jgi:hypothetical protein